MDLSLFDRVPVLHSERLLFRQLREADAQSLFEVFRDPRVTQYYDVDAMTDVSQARQMVDQMQQRYANRIGVRWAIVDRTDKRYLGSIGFNSIVAVSRKGNLGYELTSRVWGRGFGTEAVRRLVEFGHQQVGLNRIEALVMPGNVASVRVLEKAGFQAEGVLRAFGFWKGDFHDLRMFSALAMPRSQPAPPTSES